MSNPITCPSCFSDEVDRTDYEGGKGQTFIEHYQCMECNDYWEESYIHESELGEE